MAYQWCLRVEMLNLIPHSMQFCPSSQLGSSCIWSGKGKHKHYEGVLPPVYTNAKPTLCQLTLEITLTLLQKHKQVSSVGFGTELKNPVGLLQRSFNYTLTNITRQTETQHTTWTCTCEFNTSAICPSGKKSLIIWELKTLGASQFRNGRVWTQSV